MGNDFMILSNQILSQEAVNQIIKFNETSAQYGLSLSQKEATELVETRNEALSSNGRIEFGGGIINKLIYEFYDSPYLHQSEYADTMNELVEMFYYFKNESADRLSDDELILLMREYFDNRCRGSIELLQNKDLEALVHNIRFGVDDYDNLRPEKEEEDSYFRRDDI